MKKKLMIIAVAVILMLASTITVYANTETTVTLNASKTEVKVGETFTVTLKATCPDGINGIDTTYNYDEEKLELKSAAVANNSFSPLGVENQITVICSSTEKIESADIYTLTFTVKEGAEVGSTAEIGITETLLDSDAATDSEKTIEAQKITVKIVEATTDDGDDDGEMCEHTYTTKSNSTQHWQECTKCQTIETETQENHKYGTYTDNNDGKHSAICTVCSYKLTEEHNFKDKKCTECNANEKISGNGDGTTADKGYDKAGTGTIISLAAVVVAVVAIIMYRKNKKYQDII